MTHLEAKKIVLRMVEIADLSRDRKASRELYDEMALLYGRVRPFITKHLPVQTIRVPGDWKTESEHSNYIEAGYMTGKGLYEVQGRAQLMQILGILEELAASRGDDEAIFGRSPLVHESRLEELRVLESKKFDFSRLVRLCEEANVTFESGCYHATAALIRAILDHVPPVFSFDKFGEVANNHGGRSFKEAMQRLDQTAKKIADGHLHNQIRSTESLPNENQVSFAPELDVLLAELARVVKDGA